MNGFKSVPGCARVCQGMYQGGKMKKDLKLIQKQSIPGCAIVTRVENNQREKDFYNKFLPRISNHPGKYGLPWQYAKMSCNPSHFCK